MRRSTSFPPPATSPPVDPERMHGFQLYRDDKDLGELEEVLQLGQDWYFVIDARHWSYGARKLLPTRAVGSVDRMDRRAYTALEVEVIRSSPDFDPFQLSNPGYIERVEEYFAPLVDDPAPGDTRA